MHTSGRNAAFIFAACFFAPALCGCTDGPFGSLGGMNPWVRQEWAEDEKFGVTFHQRVKAVRSLRKNASKMKPDERERTSQDLALQLGNEPMVLMRVELVQTLGAFHTPAAAGGLRIALSDENAEVRIAACQAWGGSQDPEALRLLAETLRSDTDIDVRLAASGELANFRDPMAVQALGSALEDSDPAMRYRSIQSLKKASGEDYGDNISAWRQYVQGGNPPKPAAPSLSKRLRNLF